MIKKKGFTLIELLVVIAIIGLLSSVVFASLNGARVKARNASRISTLKQYAIAFELAFDDNSKYPDPGVGNLTWVCLGDYPDNRCWTNGNDKLENATLNAILDDYITLSADTMLVGRWEGAIYRCETPDNSCTTLQVLWFMEGANHNCGGEVIRDSNYQGRDVTFCEMNR
jgi:prepilin-type N-terminal cleavage/methylation domain-containing protein